MLVFGDREKPKVEKLEKNCLSRAQDQQTQQTHDAKSGNWTWFPLAGVKGSLHFINPPPLDDFISKPSLLTFIKEHKTQNLVLSSKGKPL